MSYIFNPKKESILFDIKSPLIHKSSFTEYVKLKKSFLIPHFKSLLTLTKDQMMREEYSRQQNDQIKTYKETQSQKILKLQNMKKNFLKKQEIIKSAYNNKMVLDMVLKSKKFIKYFISQKDSISCKNNNNCFQKSCKYFITEINVHKNFNFHQKIRSCKNFYEKKDININEFGNDIEQIQLRDKVKTIDNKKNNLKIKKKEFNNSLNGTSTKINNKITEPNYIRKLTEINYFKKNLRNQIEKAFNNALYQNNNRIAKTKLEILNSSKDLTKLNRYLTKTKSRRRINIKKYNIFSIPSKYTKKYKNIQTIS